jgi:Bifunctional DNA primase/polymerase, N-terminal
MLDYFDLYNKLGWKIIPIHANCKVPVWKEWTKNYDAVKARKYLEIHPYVNIGILLGDIIDVEADSESSNVMLRNITAGWPHPVYKSTRSFHHLFQSPDNRLTKKVIAQIEFRGHLHQSLLPPSHLISESSSKYVWITSPSISIPRLPPELYKLYWRSQDKPEFLLPWCAICKRQQSIHHKRYNIELTEFKKFGTRWQCKKCRKITPLMKR